MVNAKIPKTLQQKTVLTHVSGCASRLYMVEECTDNLEHQTPAERCIPPQDHIMLYTKQKLNQIIYRVRSVINDTSKMCLSTSVIKIESSVWYHFNP